MIFDFMEPYEDRDGARVTLVVSEISSMQEPLVEGDRGAFIGGGHVAMKNHLVYRIRKPDYIRLRALFIKLNTSESESQG